MKSSEGTVERRDSSTIEFRLRDYSEILAFIRGLNTLKWTIFSLSFVVMGLLLNLLFQFWQNGFFEVWETSLLGVLLCLGGMFTTLFFLIILSRIDVSLDWRYCQMDVLSRHFELTLGVETFWAGGSPKPVKTENVETGFIPRFFGKKEAGKMVTVSVLLLLVVWFILFFFSLLALFGSF